MVLTHPKFFDFEAKLLAATARLKSVEHAKQCGGASCDEEDGKWDPTKDLVGSDLVVR